MVSKRKPEQLGVYLRSCNPESPLVKAVNDLSRYYDLPKLEAVQKGLIHMTTLVIAKHSEMLAQIELEKRQLAEKERLYKTGGI